MAMKTSLENKHLGNGDYSVIVVARVLCKWTDRSVLIYRVKRDLLLCVHVIIKTLNLEISHHMADYVTEFY